MKKLFLKESDENTILITLEFLEDGYLLKTGQSAVHRCELDLIVNNNITCDELLAGIYAGLKDILTEHYQIDLSKAQGDILYRYQESVYEVREAMRSQKYVLRPNVEGNLSLRINAMRYKAQRRKVIALESRYPLPPKNVKPSYSEEHEHMSWLVCWQVFRECYAAYAAGYPDGSTGRNGDGLRRKEPVCHPVIYRSTAICSADYGEHETKLANTPRLWLERERYGHVTLRELGFRTASRLVFDPVLWHQSADRFGERTIPEYTQVYKITSPKETPMDLTEMTVPSPDLRPVTQKQDILSLMMAPLVTTVATLGVTMLLNPANSLLTAGLMATAMGATTLGVSKIVDQRTNQALKNDMDAWRRSHEEYIRWTIEKIQKRQKQDCDALLRIYPPVFEPKTEVDLIRKALMLNGYIFSRRPEDEDFLCVRLGLSTVGSELTPSLFRITGETEREPVGAIRYVNARRDTYRHFQLLMPQEQGNGEQKYDGYLKDLPQTLAKEYAYLKDAPVLMDLKKNRISCLVLQERRRSFLPHLSALLLDLCFHHSPEDVQIVMLCPNIQGAQQQQDYLYRFKHLPHFRKLFQDRSSFAFGAEEAWTLMDRVWLHIKHRISHPEESWSPHILFVVLEEYALKNHPLAAILSANGEQKQQYPQVSFLFCKYSEEKLPQTCTAAAVFCADGSGLLLPDPTREHGKSAVIKHMHKARYAFRPDAIEQIITSQDRERDLTYRAFKSLSSYYYRNNILLETPAYYSLFEILGEQADSVKQRLLRFDSAHATQSARSIYGALTHHISNHWTADQAESAWKIQIGRTHSAAVTVDLCQQADGEHLLATGDLHTGKSSFLQSFFLSLAANSNPKATKFALVDMSGVSICAKLKELPHTVYFATSKLGTMEDIQLQAKKLVLYLDDQIRHRKLQMGKLGTGDIADYNAAVCDIENHIYRKLRLHAQKDQELIQELRVLEPMPHLFVCVDDLDQLIYMASAVVDGSSFDLAEKLIYLVENARGTGVHLIASAERVSGYLPQEMLDQFELRVCLRCSDSTAWECADMWNPFVLGDICQKGRAWVCSKRSGYTEYAQLAYAGDDISGRNVTPYRMTLANLNGAYSCFFDSEDYLSRNIKDSDIVAANVWRVRRGDQRSMHRKEEKDTEDVIYVRPLNQDVVDAALRRSEDEILARRERGDRYDRPPEKKPQAQAETQNEIVVEKPDAILLGASKTGITQEEALLKTICKLYADMSSGNKY